jgi:hypothetical protein
VFVFFFFFFFLKTFKGSADPTEQEKKEFDSAVKDADAILLLYRCGPVGNEASTQTIRKNIRHW